MQSCFLLDRNVLLERREDGVEQRLEEEREGGGDDGGDLFQSEFSSGLLPYQAESSQSACVDSKLFTSSVHLLSSKTT